MVANARIAEAGVAVLAQPPTAARIAEASVSVLAEPPTGAHIAEVSVSALAFLAPCSSRRSMLWKIERTDGEILGFTSHDQPITFTGVTYSPCSSLADTASEQSSDVGAVGSVQLTGILNSDRITDADIYGGLYDDAKVEVWLVSWDTTTVDGAVPMMIASGRMGQLSFGQTSYTAEVLGAGAKLRQTALVEFFTPGCRWEFGVQDSNGIGCPVDTAAMAIHSVNVTGARGRTTLFFDHPDPGGTTIWNGGTVVFNYGANAGLSCQVNTVDWSTQTIQLWDLPPKPIAAGDSFDLFPGCPKDKPSCVIYGALLSYGGFPDVPGPDVLQQNADSLFTGNS